ncbi:hypothetical protein ACFOD4_07430 [Pseudoroseomonas globiformis]|uniref:Tetratricopeptide repeat protein n=1 Tax=Teichococcus globiformis TaxID=2307229 RepID=A0ABV7G2H2_9PROT
MPRAAIIFEDEHLQVVHQPGSSSFSLVTFGGLTDRPAAAGRPAVFWGQEPAERLGLEAVGLLAKAENWYPAASMQAAAPVMLPLLRPRRLGYGFSMGGYAALRYGTLLGLDGALAVSPQGSIDPADATGDTRFGRWFRPSLHAGMAVSAAEAAAFAVQIIDPYEAEDLAQARFIAARTELATLPLPFLGHATAWHLADSALLGQALNHVLARDTAGLRALLRRHRAHSPHWSRLMGRAALVRGRPELAERLWRRAVALGLAAAWLPVDRAAALEARSERLAPETAEPLLLQAAGLMHGLAATQLRIAATLRRRGRGAAAMPLLRRAVALEPGQAEAQLALLACVTAFAEADAVLEVLLDLARHCPSAAAEALGMALDHGKIDEAVDLRSDHLQQVASSPDDTTVKAIAALLLCRRMRRAEAWPEALHWAGIAARGLPESDQPLIEQWRAQEAMNAPPVDPIGIGTQAGDAAPPMHRPVGKRLLAWWGRRRGASAPRPG